MVVLDGIQLVLPGGVMFYCVVKLQSAVTNGSMMLVGYKSCNYRFISVYVVGHLSVIVFGGVSLNQAEMSSLLVCYLVILSCDCET